MSESVESIWADDLLNRREDADILFRFLVRRHEERQEIGAAGAYVLNLNASWGHGKSFFLDRLKRQMDAEGHLTAHVNAWKDDAGREPIVAVMAAIESALKPYLGKEDAVRQAWSAAKANSASIVASLSKGAIKQTIKRLTGDAFDEIDGILTDQQFVSEDVEKELIADAKKAGETVTTEVTTLLTKFVDKQITEYQTRISSANQFQNRLRQVLSDLGKSKFKLPFFILIDELDRCRPTYAIEMLEQVKHLFDVDNTIFIIATDGDQLSHSIKSVYGEGFDGRRYLLRFFHRHYRLEERDLSTFIRYLFDLNKINIDKISTPFGSDPVYLFAATMHQYHVTLRDAEQCFDILRSIITTWDYKVPIELAVMLPLVILFQRHDIAGMQKFMDDSGAPAEPHELYALPVKKHDDFGQFKGETKVPIGEIVRALIGRARTGLDTIYEYGRGSPVADYVSEVLQRELQNQHGSRVTRGGPISIIGQYPAVVRRIGRLTRA